ncbi:MAG TPA: recombinase family protein [Thermoleophilaceae bacterium]|nr:recombinase family protein [Thermoleophilaceae bacterium]
MAPLPLDGYIRVSRVGARDKTDGFISPDVQEHGILRTGERIEREVYMHPPELNRSGGTMDRPTFNKIMRRVRDGQSGGLIVYKTDRFARTLLGAVSTLVELGEHKAAFVSATEPALDYSTPAGRAFLHQMFTFHEFLRDTLKESWAVSQRYAIERGIHIGPNHNNWLGYSRGDDRRLVPNDQADIMREAYSRAARHDGWQSIADWLNRVAPKDSGYLWTGLTVKNTLSKRIYRGEASRFVGQDKEDRGAIITPDAHPALVDEDTWQAANAPRRPAAGGRKPGQALPLLSGIVRCAGCRYGLSISMSTSSGHTYRCRSRHASGQCPAPSAAVARHLEQHVEEAVLAEIEGTTRKVSDSRDRDAIAAQLDRAREDLASFRADREARRKLGPEWHDWLDDYLGAVRNLEAELARLDTLAGTLGEGLTRDHYFALPIDERREVLGQFIDVVFLRRAGGRGYKRGVPLEQRVRILWAGEGPDDIPRRRVRTPIKSFEFEDEVEPRVLPAQSST